MMATDDTTMGSPMPPRHGLADEWAPSDVRPSGDRLLYSLALRLRPKPEARGQSLAWGYSQVIRYWGGATLELYLRTALHAVVSLLLVVYSRAPSPREGGNPPCIMCPPLGDDLPFTNFHSPISRGNNRPGYLSSLRTNTVNLTSP